MCIRDRLEGRAVFLRADVGYVHLPPAEHLQHRSDRAGAVGQGEHDHQYAPVLLALGQIAARGQAALDALVLLRRGGYLDKQRVQIHRLVVVHAHDVAAVSYTHLPPEAVPWGLPLRVKCPNRFLLAGKRVGNAGAKGGRRGTGMALLRGFVKPLAKRRPLFAPERFGPALLRFPPPQRAKHSHCAQSF